MDPSVPLQKAVWSQFDGIWGILKDSWEVLTLWTPDLEARGTPEAPYGGFQKLGGPFLVVLTIRALQFWSPY